MKDFNIESHLNYYYNNIESFYYCSDYNKLCEIVEIILDYNFDNINKLINISDKLISHNNYFKLYNKICEYFQKCLIENRKDIDVNKIIKYYPELYTYVQDKNILNINGSICIKILKNDITLFDEINETINKFDEDKKYKIYEKIIRGKWENIKYISDEKFIIHMLKKKNYEIFRYIKNQTEDILLEYFKHKYNVTKNDLSYIKISITKKIMQCLYYNHYEKIIIIFRNNLKIDDDAIDFLVSTGNYVFDDYNNLIGNKPQNYNLSDNNVIQTREICLQQVKLDGMMLKYVKNQTMEICEEAIKNNYQALCYANYQPEYLCLKAVQNNGKLIKYVKQKTEKICEAAVKHNSYALKHVINQTSEICEMTIKNNGLALQYVLEQTEELCLMAIRQNKKAFRYIRKQTPKICLEIVQIDGNYIQYVENQTEDIKIEAIKQNKNAFVHIENQSEEFCLKAVQINGSILQYIRNKTYEICYEAIMQNEKSFRYVNVHIMDMQLCQMLVHCSLDEKFKNKIIISLPNLELYVQVIEYLINKNRFANTKSANNL